MVKSGVSEWRSRLRSKFQCAILTSVGRLFVVTVQEQWQQSWFCSACCLPASSLVRRSFISGLNTPLQRLSISRSSWRFSQPCCCCCWNWLVLKQCQRQTVGGCEGRKSIPIPYSPYIPGAARSSMYALRCHPSPHSHTPFPYSLWVFSLHSSYPNLSLAWLTTTRSLGHFSARLSYTCIKSVDRYKLRHLYNDVIH